MEFNCSNPRAPPATSNETSGKCLLCVGNTTYDTNRAWQAHAKMHTGEFHCEECGSDFVRAETLEVRTDNYIHENEIIISDI